LEWLSLPHRRSLTAKLRRYVLRQGFHDVIWAETICRTDKTEIINYIHVIYPDPNEGILISDIPDVEKGLVLTDSRGRGVFQK